MILRGAVADLFLSWGLLPCTSNRDSCQSTQNGATLGFAPPPSFSYRSNSMKHFNFTLRTLAILAFLFVFADSPLTAADDPYAVRTSDPCVLRAVAYLEQLGVPEPKLADELINNPAGVWINSTATFDDGKGHTSTVIVGLMCAFPNVTANDLARAGVLTLSAPLFNVPVPSVNLDAFAAPDLPASTQPAPSRLKTSPVGPKWYSGSRDAVGDKFYVSPNDTLPAGTVWREGGFVYVKKAVQNPFGFAMWWERTA